MAIKIVQIPIGAIMNETEIMINDADGRFKKRVDWAGKTEEEKLNHLDQFLAEGFTIVDAREYRANSFVWLRYTLHLLEGRK